MGLLVRYNHYTHALWHNAYPHTEYNNKHLMGCTPSWSTWHSLAMTRQPGQWWSLSHSTVLELTLQKGCKHEGGNYLATGHGDLILAGRFNSFSKYFSFTQQAACSNNHKTTYAEPHLTKTRSGLTILSSRFIWWEISHQSEAWLTITWSNVVYINCCNHLPLQSCVLGS